MEMSSQYIEFVSAIIIPVAGIFLTIVGGVLGYFCGIIKERNSIKWKENREALQCAYGYFDVLHHRMKENMPFNDNMWKSLNDLKYSKNFNITNKQIFASARKILEAPVYDIQTKSYNDENKDNIIAEIEQLLPKIKKELSKCFN